MPTTKIEKQLPETKSLDARISTKAVEGESTVVFVASSPREDRVGESVDVESLRLPLKGGGYVIAKDLTGNEQIDISLLIDHNWSVENIIGSVRKAYLNELGELVFEAGIASRAKAQDMLSLIKEDHVGNSFSITMRDFEFDWNTDTIYNAEITEVSLVFKGANREARLLQVKSLLKQGKPMSDDKASELAKKKAQLEALQKEIADAEQVETPEKPAIEEVPAPMKPTEEANTTTEVSNTEVKPAGEAVETEEVTETPVDKTEDEETTEVTEDTEVKTNLLEGDKKMAEAVNAGEVVEKSAVPTQTKEAVTYSKDDFRAKFVEQFVAKFSNDTTKLKTLNKQVAEMEGKSKAIDFSDAEAIFQSEIVANDILEQYTQLGNVGALVNRVDILGATAWKRPVMANGAGFRPVGDEEEKQEDEPVFSNVLVTPKEHAVIVAWYDAVARQTPLAVYQSIVQYIAQEYRRLEDKIVLSFAGVTTGEGDVFAATGLVPILSGTAGRVVTAADYDSSAIATALGIAYGKVKSDKTLTLVANRVTWGLMATAVDTQGRTVFNTVGNQVQAGALGTFNVVVSEEIADNYVVVGAFNDYDLVTRGTMETLFSREATVGAVNLFTNDMSALRANVDIAGKPVRVNSFALIHFSAIS